MKKKNVKGSGGCGWSPFPGAAEAAVIEQNVAFKILKRL